MFLCIYQKDEFTTDVLKESFMKTCKPPRTMLWNNWEQPGTTASLLSLLSSLVNWLSYNKQMFHAFLFNIRNCSPKVINMQRREAELNIILPRVNNFDIKQKRAWSIFFIICHQHQTRSIKINTNKMQHILVKTQVFYYKNWTATYLTTTPSKSFYIIFVDIFF